ncbi:MAG: polysaccharide deacetylase family protein [Firmicutes bacterium]|nr:polysaccharide deacetylase family protein [Bacillota bacterium]
MRVFVLRLRWQYILLVLILAFFAALPQVREPLVTAVTSRGRLIPIYRVDTPDKVVAISFDATWGTDLTDEILAILKQNGIRTTFFLAGYWIDKHPDYVVKIAAHGHEIGNHSYSHPHMNSLTAEGVIQELERNAEMIRDLVGEQPLIFRPPFGEYNNTVIQAASSIGYKTIQWSVDSLDWKNSTSDQIYARVMSQIKPGDIVLFHNAAPGTPGAIRRIIPDLLSQGYRIVPVSEIILDGDYYIDHDGTQKRKPGGN